METSVASQTIIDNFLQRLNERDAEGIAALFADDIDWYVPGNAALPWVGARSRRAEVVEYFRTMWPFFEEGKSIVTLGNIVMSADNIVIFALFQHTIVGNGKTFQSPVAFHLWVNKGKISGLHLYEDTWVVSQAFSAQ